MKYYRQIFKYSKISDYLKFFHISLRKWSIKGTLLSNFFYSFIRKNLSFWFLHYKYFLNCFYILFVICYLNLSSFLEHRVRKRTSNVEFHHIWLEMFRVIKEKPMYQILLLPTVSPELTIEKSSQSMTSYNYSASDHEWFFYEG